jgi:hypothetical protein
MTDAPTIPQNFPARDRTRTGLVLSIIGFLIFMLGAKPEYFGLDRSPVIGFVQIIVFELGLGLLCLGGYIGLGSLWNGEERTIAGDIGLRLLSTGYVIAIFTGMADIFGMGTQSFPEVPFFGPWQAVGVSFGQIIIALGMLLLIPYHHFQRQKKA